MKPRFQALVFSAGFLALTTLGFQTQAQIMTLASGNSTASVNVGAQAGMFYWSVEGVNQLNQQWFWYRIGATPEASIDTISPPVITQSTANSMTATYANALLSVRVDYNLTGGAVGSGNSTLLESVTIHNVAGSVLDLHFFQYSDFDLGGTAGGDMIQLGKDTFGRFNEALQTQGALTFSETGVTLGAIRGEASFFNNTLNSLNDAAPTSLNNNAGPVGPGDVTWAFEWDNQLAAGDSLIISKTKFIQVPEPGSVFLLGLGLGLALAFRRNGKSA